MTWDNAGNLASIHKGTNPFLPSSTSGVSYTYLANGQRRTKTVGSQTTTYRYNNGLLLSQKTESAGSGTGSSETLSFTYDTDGKPVTLTYKQGSNAAVTYFYAYNGQGDVIAIYNSSNSALVGSYEYDLWGKLISVTPASSSSDPKGILTKNPFRYRGYYYDNETGYYYLNARYYDPQVRRFIGAEPNVYAGGFDNGAGLNGYNAFDYCANSPVNAADYTGEFVVSTTVICITVGALVCGTIGGFIGNAYAKNKGYQGKEKVGAIVTGVLIGGVAGGVVGYVVAPAIAAATHVGAVSVTSAGISTIAAEGTSFGKLGILIENGGQQIIDWTKTSIHGLERMVERGVTKDMIELWVKTGKALQQTPDKILYITKQGAVVVTNAGKIVTTYSSDYFDAEMQRVVECLFGK